ncbi:peptidase M50 [Beutenbergia cavernae DSM 12333]|uniref:Peptidase M50 n=2 Tax=Beutenbergia TaxID=84756 RepID=C5BWT3_BEUC1|nr:peptidase M50 [Beutenbergia cavernae DSM 12333]
MFWLGVLVLVIGLLISIALHEVGHLLPAKRFGVKVSQYMVGFGKTLWSTRRGDTEYGFKAIPLGGYVRMVGMYPPARAVSEAGPGAAPTRKKFFSSVMEDARAEALSEVQPGEERRTFWALSVPKKLVVMFGGPFVNLVIAFVLLAVALMGIGLPQLTSTVGTVSQCVLPYDADRECASADPVAPATAAGLEPGDQVLSWGGTPVEDWADLQAAIRAGGAEPVDVEVSRGGEDLTVTVTPTMTDRPVVDAEGFVETDEAGNVVTAPAPFVGVAPEAALVRQPISAVPAVFGDALGQTFGIILTLPQRLVSIASSTFGGQERDPNVIGLIGVGRIAGEAAATDTDFGFAGNALLMLQILASLNLALFAFNMIPLLPLDGGHIAGALWEGARRRIARWRERPDPGPVDTVRLLPLTYVVFVVLIGMSLLLAIADIVDPISLTGG